MALGDVSLCRKAIQGSVQFIGVVPTICRRRIYWENSISYLYTGKIKVACNDVIEFGKIIWRNEELSHKLEVVKTPISTQDPEKCMEIDNGMFKSRK